jgi:cytochrome P450
MTGMRQRPAHVPAGLVRPCTINQNGSVGEILDRFAAYGQDPERVVWLDETIDPEADLPGMWLLTRSEDIRLALQDPGLFSSDTGITPPGLELLPIGLDPPEHGRYRRLLNPLLAPPVIRSMETAIQARAVELVDGIRDRGSCEFVGELAVKFPTRIFTSWLGLPPEQTGDFVALVQGILHRGDRAASDRASLAVMGILRDLIAARLARPADDLMSQIVRLRPHGEPMTERELMGVAFLLFLAGLDTVAAAMSFALAHLAGHPAQRRAVATGAVPVPTAVEELLRRYSFVNMVRRVTRDAEFAGTALRAGDLVLTSTHLASADQGEYADPLTVDFDRGPTRHYGFGAGVHRCIGSHLARLELRTFLTVWHDRIPEYELAAAPAGYAGAVMGIRELWLRWPTTSG